MGRYPVRLIVDGKIRCAKCELLLPADRVHFSLDARKSSGLGSYCRPCKAERNRVTKARERDRRRPVAVPTQAASDMCPCGKTRLALDNRSPGAICGACVERRFSERFMGGAMAEWR